MELPLKRELPTQSLRMPTTACILNCLTLRSLILLAALAKHKVTMMIGS